MIRGFRRSVGGCSYAEMGCASGLGGDGGGTFDLGCLKDGGARAWQTGAGRDAWVEAGSGIGDWTAWARQTCRELAPAWKMFPHKDAHHKGGDHGGKHLVSEELVREADARSEPKTTCVPGRLATVRGPMTVNQAKRHCLERGLPGFVYRHQPAPGGHSKKYGTGAQVWCLSEVTDPTGARFEQNANYDVYVAMPAQTPTETPAETHAGAKPAAGGGFGGFGATKPAVCKMSKTTCTPSGQPLTQFLTPHHGFTCDACGTTLPQGASAYGNRAEDYDVCSTCFGASVFGSGAAEPGGSSFATGFGAGFGAAAPGAGFGYGFGQQAGAQARGAAFGAQASVDQTMQAINAACKARGGAHAGYSCKTVSWDDAARGTVGGGLSSLGSNITDTYLKAKDGQRLFTVRPDNWNEKLGRKPRPPRSRSSRATRPRAARPWRRSPSATS